MDKKRPRGRQKNVTGGGMGVHRRGEGLHMGGPVGSAGGYQGRPGGHGPQDDKGLIDEALGTLAGGGGSGGSGNMENLVEQMVVNTVAQEVAGKKGGGSKLLPLILVALLLFGGGGGLLGGLLGGGGSGISTDHALYSGGMGQTSGGWSGGSNTGKLNTSVAKGARAKRTVLKGDGKDTVTIMVYMCGTDLESKSGMGTADLQEMAAADIADNVNLLVYTGGCANWRNQVVSRQVNQIYQIKDGGLTRLVSDAGNPAMTDPDTLTEYIKWCAERYPADRNELILWDHGGGSISGYGYDEKYPNSGSMSLAGINQALKNSGMTFDFIGFDACLMATMENALMLSQYADYLIASEETEPGVGWYYTNWLTQLSRNTSMPTLEIGKQIVDDFVNVCEQKCRGQQTTLSLVDLAELEATGPEALAEFSRSTGELIRNKEYKTVSNARNQAREFARSVGIDQVDLVHLARNMGTDEGEKLADTLQSAVKYNLTSANMTNAYGVAIYFPYKKVSSVNKMVQTYEEIGMDEEYTRCIKQFASLEVGGQAVSGGSASPLPSLLGTLMSEGSASSTVNSADMVSQLLGTLLSGNVGNISGLTGANSGFLDGRVIEDATEYLTDNQFDAGQLIWEDGADGRVLSLKEDQWDLIQTLELNVFYDDGEGFIDLGLDNVYEFDEDGNLRGDYDRTWIAINGQPVAYYFLDEVDDGENYTINGRVPAMLNGERVDLILTFDNEHPYGYIAGARTDYEEDVTETVSRGLTELAAGDELDFLCDYYSYDGEFQDNYYLGETMTVGDEMTISNVDVGEGGVQATYRLTDIYNQHYWTPVME